MRQSRSILFLSAISVLATLSACTSLGTHLPDIDTDALATERKSQVVTAFGLQKGYLERLANVAQPILTENSAFCPRTRPYYGVVTHSEDSYSKHILPEVQSELGLTETPIIIHIVPQSPAAKAGVKIGDIILDWTGKPIPAVTLRKLDVESHGRKKITVKRGEDTHELTIETIPACDYAVGIRNSDAVNAYATGRSIAVTTGMMDFTKTDEELAAIIGHELAHNTLGHIRKITTNYILSLGGTRYTRSFESEADYVGLYYAARAGYDIENVEDIWRRIGARHSRNIGRAKTHPTTPDRYLRLKATYKEIEKKRIAGRPLLPNFIKESPTDS